MRIQSRPGAFDESRPVMAFVINLGIKEIVLHICIIIYIIIYYVSD